MVMDWVNDSTEFKLSHKEVALLFAKTEGYDDANALIVTQPGEDESSEEEVAKGVFITSSPKRLTVRRLSMYLFALFVRF
jgi:hypothetical protein